MYKTVINNDSLDWLPIIKITIIYSQDRLIIL